MPEGSIRKLVIVIMAIVVMTGLLVDSAAQKRRYRTRRRPSAPKITNPEIYQPADNSNSAETPANSNSNSNSAPAEDPDSMKRTIRTLSNQVDKLNDKLNDM